MGRHQYLPADSAASYSGAAHESTSAPWTRLILATLSRATLLGIVGLALWAAAPALLGWQPTTVMTGSMQPRLAVGDIAIAKPATPQDLTAGRLVLFDDPDHPGRLRLHRLISFDDKGFAVTKGDANPGEDSTHVDPRTIHGVGALRVPLIGLPITWIINHQYWLVLLAAASLIGIAVLTRLDRDLQKAGPATDAGDDPPHQDSSQDGTDDDQPLDLGPSVQIPDDAAERLTGPSVPELVGSGRSNLRRSAVGAMLTALVATLAIGGAPSWAAYTASASNTGNNLAAATYYSCSKATMAGSPYLFWKFDETTGTPAADSSGNGRAGSYRPTRSSDTTAPCDAGGAATFDGTAQLVSPTAATTAVGSNTFTVESWFKTSTARGGKIVGYGNAQTGLSSSYDKHIYMTNTGTLIFGVYPSAAKTITSPGSSNNGSWHYVAATLSTAGMKLYVDGVEVAADPATTTAEGYAGLWRVGGDNLTGWPSLPTSQCFAGSIDNVAIYNSALTATTIGAHYAARR